MGINYDPQMKQPKNKNKIRNKSPWLTAESAHYVRASRRRTVATLQPHSGVAWWREILPKGKAKSSVPGFSLCVEEGGAWIRDIHELLDRDEWLG